MSKRRVTGITCQRCGTPFPRPGCACYELYGCGWIVYRELVPVRGWRKRRRLARRRAARQAGTTAWRVQLRELRAALRFLAGRPGGY